MLAERGLLRLLLDLNNLILAKLDYPGFLAALSAAIQPVVRHEHISVALYDRDAGTLRVPMTYDQACGVTRLNVVLPLDGSPEGVTLQRGFSGVFLQEDLKELGAAPQTSRPEVICCVPLPTGHGIVGVLRVTSSHAREFSARRVEALVQASTSIAAAMQGIQRPDGAPGSIVGVPGLVRTMQRKPT